MHLCVRVELTSKRTDLRRGRALVLINAPVRSSGLTVSVSSAYQAHTDHGSSILRRISISHIHISPTPTPSASTLHQTIKNHASDHK